LQTDEDKIRFEDYKRALLRYGFSEAEAQKQAAIRLQKEKRDTQKQLLAVKFAEKQTKGKENLQGKVYD
jgi:hypothetical protein